MDIDAKSLLRHIFEKLSENDRKAFVEEIIVSLPVVSQHEILNRCGKRSAISVSGTGSELPENSESGTPKPATGTGPKLPDSDFLAKELKLQFTSEKSKMKKELFGCILILILLCLFVGVGAMGTKNLWNLILDFFKGLTGI